MQLTPPEFDKHLVCPHAHERGFASGSLAAQ
jgi:hypothetical protein